MKFIVSKIKLSQLGDREELNRSSHRVFMCHLNKEGAKNLKLDKNQVIFTKEASRLERQEESTFSCLYQIDIGESAARTQLYEEKGREVGIASIGLKQFIEYWKLGSFKESKKYNAKHNTDLQNDVFGVDNKGKREIKMVKGLASVLMSSWLYAEDDLHAGNFGLARDKSGHLIWARLDFGMSFASITNQSGRHFREVNHHFDQISLTDIYNFPILTHATPFYWPTRLTTWNHTFNFKGAYKHSAFRETDKEIFSNLRLSKEFIKEKHEFLLKQFLIDIQHKKDLIVNNIDKPRNERLASTIEARILKLRWIALADPKFKDYVLGLTELDKQALFDEISNNLLVIDLDRESSNKACQHNMGKLLKLLAPEINLEKLNFGNEQNYFEIIFNLENHLINLQANLNQLDNSIKLKNERVNLEFELDKLYSIFLHTDKSNGQTKEQRLTVIQNIIDRRAVLAPINQLIIESRVDSIPPRKFFEDIRIYWLTPNLISSAVLEQDSDDKFKSKMLVKIRGIQQMINELPNMKVNNRDKNLLLKDVRLVYEKYKDVVNNKIELNVVIKNLTNIERDLVKLKYKYLFPDFTKQFFSIDKDGSDEFSVIGQTIKYSITTLLPEYIDHCYENKQTLSIIEQSNFISSLKNLESLISEFFNEDFINNLNRGSLPNKVQQKFKTGLHRINTIFNKYGVSSTNEMLDENEMPIINADGFMTLSVKNKSYFIQDINFVMTRLALDLQREQAINNLKQSNYLLNFDGKSLFLHKEITQQLIEANLQLSMAMAKPSYHDRNIISKVAEAGLLAARALKNPTLDNTFACLEQVQKLTDSNQTRLKTKVSLALAVVGLLCLSISLFTLMGFLALPILSTLSVTSLQVVAAASAITFFGGAAYTLYRFNRDKDKVERKLKKLGEITMASLDGKIIDPVDDNIKFSQNFNLYNY